MRKIFTFILLAIGFIIFPRIAFAEKISNFEVTIEINSDTTINVQEKIDYDFEELQRHGIYRDIPIKYKARGGNYQLRISNINVVDENGKEYSFAVSYPGKNAEIKIGDADKYVTGQKTYLISYTIARAINFFDDHDELYWNATGNEWEVAIDNAQAIVKFPQSISVAELQAICYAGALGSTSECQSNYFQENSQGLIEGVSFAEKSLYPQEGLTVVTGLPKGILTPPSKWQSFWDLLKDNGILFLPLLVFGLMFYLWNKRGRDPEGKGTIIAQFEPPDNLTPAEVGTIVDEKTDKKDISAEIIYLAVNGYLKIIRKSGKGVFAKEDYELEKLKESGDLANEFEKKLMDSFFSDQERVVRLSSLKNKFYKDLEDVKNKIYKSILDKRYFPKNPRNVRAAYIAINILIIFVSLCAYGLIGGLGVFSFILSAIIVFIYSFFMPAKTKKGVEAKEYILGLKYYLTVAEKDRLKFHNAPQKDPQHFEKLLPYAMVLGVEKEWAKQFEGIYKEPPSWYSDPSGRYFTALYLANSLNGFQNQANTTLASRPSSASGGGSGFGGGGSSGGGFGGGGGGSW
ncbi:MAG: hypothetical protein COT24_05305 [Candidatus Kerfeldbacteria bacterium CG08_land_8_20_14_0_20_40_16]|uniref:DUF2207 domain-containing protein n=1 Tax=Candidatus Kerfeldbacteria bacterium CG08_land_8_20_14_0_20_40_16 TaxID=2014244 RepID=A0A2H0YUE7_9BACT|nr:MAG: hypothetical protein COT24_05305 [Candidatus Kerfeldbacteria bacterium CG08_land_8_20_14_0_20_40_16]